MNDLQKDKDDGWKYADTWMTRKSTLTACRLHSTCEFGLKSAKKIGGWKSCKNGGGVITENFAKKIFYCCGKKVGGRFYFIFYFLSKILKMHNFNKNLWTTRVRPRTTCWRHWTREFGLKSWKFFGGGQNRENKLGEGDTVTFIFWPI